MNYHYKIIEKGKNRIWWGKKIYVRRYKIFLPHFILHYNTPFDKSEEDNHIRAIDIDKYNIECLTQKAYVELATAKRDYEKLRKTL